jgi:hypothetical protein
MASATPCFTLYPPLTVVVEIWLLDVGDYVRFLWSLLSISLWFGIDAVERLSYGEKLQFSTVFSLKAEPTT